MIRSTAELEAAFQILLELAKELRGYTREWDWKYGEDWDKQLEAAEAFLKERQMSEAQLVVVEGGEFVQASDAAVKLRFDSRTVWIPLSQLVEHSEDYDEITIPEWLVIEKQLDDFVRESEVRVW